MFAALRSFFRRRSSSAYDVQRALFSDQKALHKEIQALLSAYERRIAYLQDRLLGMTARQAQEDRRLFDEAHQSLKRILARLHAADQEAETLLREWHDWLAQDAQQGLSGTAKERLEILRSELAVRGLLPQEKRIRLSVVSAPTKKKVITYKPTALGTDTLASFDEVFGPRLVAERDWLDRTWDRSLVVGVRVPWKLWLAHRRKRVYGWHRRLKQIIG